MGESNFSKTKLTWEQSLEAGIPFKTMALVQRVTVSLRSGVCRRCLSSSSVTLERFGSGDGSSGWKWEKGGVGMGGKDVGKATEIKDTMGKDKDYKVPEFFGYTPYSYFDLEKDMVKQRNPQPKSGATEFWTYSALTFFFKN